MSDHAWTQEHIAAFVMNGLTAEEIDQVNDHARQCPECTTAIAAERRMDRGLSKLFADVRPNRAMEDWAARSTRAFRPRRFDVAPWLPRMAAAAGVLLGLCSVGALAGAFMNLGELPMPGTAWNQREAKPVAEVPQLAGSASSEAALPSNASLSQALAAAKNLTQLSAQNNPSQSYALPTHDVKAAGSTILGIGGGGSPGFGGGIGGQGGIGGIGGGGIGGGIGGGGKPADAIRNLNDGASLPPPTYYGGYPAQGKSPPTPSVRGVPYINRVAPSTEGKFFRPSEFRSAAPSADSQKGQESGAREGAQQERKPDSPAEPDTGARRIVIRSGDIEFEVGSFDEAAAVITKLVVAIPGAFVGTVNREKLPNGKVRGAITVRTPPEHLDRLILELRRDLGAAGELKGMRVASQDVTKQYTDLESRLRAARTMEQRLIQITKEGKGEIKQLLEAEKELGVWRTRIEEFEGEIRYYANLAALATLTVNLTEREIRTAAAVTETERVQAGVEVEDVDKAYQQTLLAVADAKGRVSKSELKQLSAGQFNASLQFEVPQETGGPLRDRLRQLGRVARLEIDRVQKATGGTPPTDAKVKRGDTVFLVQIYNLANVAPRETQTIQVAVPDVRAAYQTLRDAVAKTVRRVFTAQLNEQDAQNVSAQFDFEVRREDEGVIRAALDKTGDVISRQITRAAEGDETTDAKALYRVAFVATNRLPPRETTTLTLEVPDVEQTAAALTGRVAEAKGRQINAQSSRDESGRVSARLIYEVPLDASKIIEQFKSAGTLQSLQSVSNPEAPAGQLATARLDVTLTSRGPIVADDNGLWPQIRRGLGFSLAVLLTSVTWVVFGLCVVLPWGLAGYVGYRLVRRVRA